MSLGVIPMFWFEVLRILVKNRKNELEKLGITGPFAAAPLGFTAAKPLFTWAKIFILFPKVVYSCTDSLEP